MRRNEHLIFWLSLCSKLLCDGVCQLPGDRFLRMERLGVVVEILRAGFAELISGGQKLELGKSRRAVLTTDEVAIPFWKKCFLFLLDVVGDAGQRCGTLFLQGM